MEISKKDQLAELKREIAMRENVYPRWVRAGKISQKIAAHRIAALKAVCSDFEARHINQQIGLGL